MDGIKSNSFFFLFLLINFLNKMAEALVKQYWLLQRISREGIAWKIRKEKIMHQLQYAPQTKDVLQVFENEMMSDEASKVSKAPWYLWSSMRELCWIEFKTGEFEILKHRDAHGNTRYIEWKRLCFNDECDKPYKVTKHIQIPLTTIEYPLKNEAHDCIVRHFVLEAIEAITSSCGTEVQRMEKGTFNLYDVLHAGPDTVALIREGALVLPDDCFDIFPANYGKICVCECRKNEKSSDICSKCIIVIKGDAFDEQYDVSKILKDGEAFLFSRQQRPICTFNFEAEPRSIQICYNTIMLSEAVKYLFQ